ncbi:hypothetical protein, partial [Rhizobium leguminosarum]|uniref:hypothetical protein n=1 Tax=Rhizobium leguminosarum TaxID=384 RepID=UPI001C9288A8
QTDQPYREFLTFIHNLVSTSFKWTPHAKAHSNTEGAEKFALTNVEHVCLNKAVTLPNACDRPVRAALAYCNS